MGQEGPALKDPPDDVGIADIDGQQHGIYCTWPAEDFATL
jgi:hypothetical protein